MRLDAGRSSVTKFARNPKYPGSISTSAGMLTAGRPRRLPMASAISRNWMPSPSIPCQDLPAGPFSSARGEVAAMHGRPQVRAVSGVADDALLLRERDQQREEAGIGRAVRDGRNPHDRGPHSPLGEADYGGFHDVTNPQGP